MLDFGIELIYHWRSLIRLLYPAYCILCRIPLLLDEIHLCVSCAQTIEPLKAPMCLKCARPLPPYGNNRSTCSQCRSERPRYDRGFALVLYQDSVKTIFHQIKFQKKLWLLNIFLRPLQNFSTSPELKNYDLLIPVPLDSRRERERGFNQALLIAQMLERSVPKEGPRICKLLKKKKKTLPQSQLRRTERLRNLEGAFSIKRRGCVRGKHILLVDDILTTGSTINECARLLKEDGAERVDFLTIARSQSR